MKGRIYVVDDHDSLVAWLVEELERDGYRADGSASPERAVEAVLSGDYDLVVADVEMPGLRGPALMAEIHRHRPDQLVLLITAFGSVQTAVEAVRAGACDFVTKPFSIEVLLLAVERALHDRRMRRQIVRVTRSPPEVVPAGIVARSDAMRRVLERARKAARVDSAVLITGETGTGKGTLAQYLHAVSRRSAGPFVQLNCAGIPTTLVESELFGVRRGAYTDAHQDRDGLFVRANGGTLFLDEVGDLPAEVQPKLLDVLETGRVRPLGGAQERTVDVRIVAATHRDLRDAVQQRVFRADLLFRLDVIGIHLPPLRTRPEDVIGLVELFLARNGARTGRAVVGVSDEALGWLVAQPWTGNVRELANVVEKAVALGEHDVITLADVRPDPAPAPAAANPFDAAVAAGAPLEQVEVAYMQRVVDACGGNLSEAARRLGVDRRTLHRRLRP